MDEGFVMLTWYSELDSGLIGIFHLQEEEEKTTSQSGILSARVIGRYEILEYCYDHTFRLSNRQDMAHGIIKLFQTFKVRGLNRVWIFRSLERIGSCVSEAEKLSVSCREQKFNAVFTKIQWYSKQISTSVSIIHQSTVYPVYVWTRKSFQFRDWPENWDNYSDLSIKHPSNQG